jgi:aspartyl-tRNA(Asn)/glutamyl-tRNA(Gln) amidotransferase subunit B
MNERYEAVIGLEVHVELSTATKIFCACENSFGDAPNTHVCPVCMGLPGAMPVLNRRAVELAIRAGLALGAEVSAVSRFDRKNYFYPDLPKGYQISQNEFPICRDGRVVLTDAMIGVERIHLEEDAGKLIHDSGEGTLVDYNRCGVPLIEIVSRPDIRSAGQAKEYLSELRLALIYAGVSQCRMERGEMRCDVNISVRPRGESGFGVRTEIKNVNSFAFVGKAIEYEIERQTGILDAGGQLSPQTRRFDASTAKTYAMRSKESAADYRFFPEPDLPELCVDDATVEKIKAHMERGPSEYRELFEQKYSLSAENTKILVSEPCVARYFERAAALTEYPRLAANIFLTDIIGKREGERFAVSAEQLAQIATLYGEQTVNSSTVKKLIDIVSGTQLSPADEVESRGLSQIRDEALIGKMLDEVLAETPKLWQDFVGGKSAAKKAIIGRVMAKCSGRAAPDVLERVWQSFVLSH